MLDQIKQHSEACSATPPPEATPAQPRRSF
jgi:hypothetical protein